MNTVFISTYELGRQPFGLASPAAWLRREGFHVTCLDLSRQPLDEAAVRAAEFIAFYVPMHTATRLAVELLPAICALNPGAHLCFYGLYAPVNEAYLRSLGAQTILGGEFEEGLVSLVRRLAAAQAGGSSQSTQSEAVVSLSRQHFLVPDRAGLVPLTQYAHLILADGTQRTVGTTEASRGCKHLCRHCPIVPVYNGVFRVVQQEVVLADIRQQVAAGAQHITFGDPDFFNGPAHARALVESLHREFPSVTYDVTIKVEHLLKHQDLLPVLRDTGCAFVTTAVESVDDAILEKLDKGHTRADFLAVVRSFREIGLVLQPTFVPFTPWTTLDGYRDLLRIIADNRLVPNVAPIQFAIRLLIPAGSRLLELEDLPSFLKPFDPARLFYPWRHPDARVDALCDEVIALAAEGDSQRLPREKTFEAIWQAAFGGSGEHTRPQELAPVVVAPHISEAWYCCAEPTQSQLAPFQKARASLPSADSFV